MMRADIWNVIFLKSFFRLQNLLTTAKKKITMILKQFQKKFNFKIKLQ